MSETREGTGRREVLAFVAGSALFPITGAQASAIPSKRAKSSGRGLPFDEGWRFFRGEGLGFEKPTLADHDWRRVDLPHDWSIENVPGGRPPDQFGPFDKGAPGTNATGYTVGGEGWYRKHFCVEGYPVDCRIEILFGGSYLETEVWLNGNLLGRNVHGYIPFAFDLTPYLNRAGENVLAVRVRNLGRNSRWYTGSGLYRQVTLDVLPAAMRLARWGVSAWTRRLADGKAEIDVTTTILEAEAGAELVNRLVDWDGRVVAEVVSPAGGAPRQTLVVRGPKLWSPSAPQLYTLETELRQLGRTVDRLEQPFGIRIIDFDPRRGMTINGNPTKLRGGCVHHDNGLLGACAFPDADARRVRLLKARGFNAIRSSHNPPSNTLREACDRLGMLIIPEAFDVWFSGKEPQDFATLFREHWQEVIAAMVLPARNSPSVIMWSIGNEIPLRATDEGVHWEWTLANGIKQLDATRPVTAGVNGVLGQEVIAGVETARPGFAGQPDNASTIFIDVPGYNYRLEEVQREFVTRPERVVYASETFPKNVFDYTELMQRTPQFLGEFVWTAMDYIGEAGIGTTAHIKKGSPPYYSAGWPVVNAGCGDLDLTGRQKAQSLARDVAWGVSHLEMVVQRPVPDDMFEWSSPWGWSDELASWTWTGGEGKSLAVRVYTSGDLVQLRLNGLKVGEKQLAVGDKQRAELMVPYSPGVLEAVAYRQGSELARRKLATVGPAKRLHLVAETASMPRGPQGLAYVRIQIVDAMGRVRPDDKSPVGLTIAGPAELLAFGSAEPTAIGSLQASSASTFRGEALAVLRSRGRSGPVTIEAITPSLPKAVITLR